MDWDNSAVIEFIELLQSEPIIWDPKHRSNKNRPAVAEAWQRIQSAFSIQCTIEDLKKKRNSLMSAYRDRRRKMKNDPLLAGTDDGYKPTWFAFDALHSFLAPVYECQGSLIYTEEQTTPHRAESLESEELESPQVTQLACRRTHDLLVPRLLPDEPFRAEKPAHREPDENDLFAQILAKKLRRMDDEDRLRLTNDIQNLVFKYEMNVLARLNDKPDLKAFGF